MPEIKAPPVERDVDLERIDYLFGGEQSPDDAAALKLVTNTFGRYESQRQTVERRWNTASNLYHGVIDQRNWEGTSVPRASLAVPIVYDQVESAYPIICDALFGYWPTFFEVTPQPGATTADAAQVRDVLASYLETPFDETGLTPVAHMKIAVRQAEKLGDGAIELSWDMASKRPIVEWCDAKDLYLDPSTPGPMVDWSPSLIRVKKMTVQELADLRGVEGVNIPSDTGLNYYAKTCGMSSGDIIRQRDAAARKEAFFPLDLRPDPRHQQIEVLMYWTKDRLIWVLGREWVAINEENPYGFIPYCRAPFTLVEGRPHSMSIPDALEGDQKYAQGIRNARIDNLSLAMNPPRVRAQGTPTSASSTAWRPGLEDRVSDPKQVSIARVENVTADAYREEEIIHQGAAKRIGVNDMVQSGVPAPSNANRSATGVASQAKAVGTRLSTPVSNFEDYLIVPMLYKMQKMIAKFAPEQFEVTVKGGQTVPAAKATFAKNLLFRMTGANRMVTKDRLAMFLQPISQLLFNDAVMKQANLQGMTLDFTEWQRFFQDATGTAKTYDFFRQMSQQEQQALSQPDPKMMMEMQKAQMEAQTRMQIMDMKSKTDLKGKQMDMESKSAATGEKSAIEILKLLAKDRADQWSHIDTANARREKSTSKS